MAEQNTLTQDQLIEWYMEDVLSDEKALTSIYSFTKKHEIEERSFYQFFSDFDHLNQVIFSVFASSTLEMLSQDEDFNSGDAKHKLLSFYYTFFEFLTANRSFVNLKLKQNANKLESLKSLKLLRETFKDFIKTLDIKKPDLQQEKLNEFQQKGIEETSWVQLMFTIQFWLNDTSPNFEKTDIFIEKSLKAAFDLSDFTPLKSVFDFAKFVYKEHVK
jgi:hypothetical protein